MPLQPNTAKQRMGNGRDPSKAIVFNTHNDGHFDKGRGMIIDRELLAELLQKEQIGARFKQVRVWLNEIYDREYSRDRIAVKTRYSNQGLKNVEEGLKQPRKRTIDDLAQFYLDNYNVPIQVFTEGATIENVRGFYLGKNSDRNAFFDNYYEEHNKAHYLDDRTAYHEEIEDQGKYIYDSGYLDERGYDVIHLEDGYRLDRVRIELRMKGYQVSSGKLLWEKRLEEEQTVIAAEDLEFLEDLIEKQIAFLSKRFNEVQLLKKQLILDAGKRSLKKSNQEKRNDS